MPIEREVKFLMAPDTDATWIKQELGLLHFETKEIIQIYLSPGVRIRMIDYGGGEDLRYVFTYKQKTSMGTVEIETEIERSDFVNLSEKSIGSIHKRREVYGRIGLPALEFDHISRVGGDEIDLRIIEIEHLPSEIPLVNAMSQSMGRKLVHRVPDDDKDFSNFSLSNPEYAAMVMKNIALKYEFMTTEGH